MRSLILNLKHFCSFSHMLNLESQGWSISEHRLTTLWHISIPKPKKSSVPCRKTQACHSWSLFRSTVQNRWNSFFLFLQRLNNKKTTTGCKSVLSKNRHGLLCWRVKGNPPEPYTSTTAISPNHCELAS